MELLTTAFKGFLCIVIPMKEGAQTLSNILGEERCVLSVWSVEGANAQKRRMTDLPGDTTIL